MRTFTFCELSWTKSTLPLPHPRENTTRIRIDRTCSIPGSNDNDNDSKELGIEDFWE
jgi:hypothetical protein